MKPVIKALKRSGYDNNQLGWSFGSSVYWDGKMGDIHIYNRTLTDDEIKTIYFSVKDKYGI